MDYNLFARSTTRRGALIRRTAKTAEELQPFMTEDTTLVGLGPGPVKHSYALSMRVTTITHYLARSLTGKRIVVYTWADGRVEVKAIRGDGRTPRFEEFLQVTLDNPTVRQVDEAVEACYAAFSLK